MGIWSKIKAMAAGAVEDAGQEADIGWYTMAELAARYGQEGTVTPERAFPESGLCLPVLTGGQPPLQNCRFRYTGETGTGGSGYMSTR